jgi:hypothetical protein
MGEERNMKKDYLGDSVYVEFDEFGFSIILTTENGITNYPSNRIALEPEVYDALKRYVERFYRSKK